MHLAEWRDAFRAPSPILRRRRTGSSPPKELARSSRFAGDRGTDIADHRVSTRSAYNHCQYYHHTGWHHGWYHHGYWYG
jgi:hypothetical protein